MMDDAPRTHAMVKDAPSAWGYAKENRQPLSTREMVELERHGFVMAARNVPVCTGFVADRPRGHRHFVHDGGPYFERHVALGKWCTYGCHNRYCPEHICRNCARGRTRPEMRRVDSSIAAHTNEGPEWFLTCDEEHVRLWRPWCDHGDYVGVISDLLKPKWQLTCISSESQAFIAVPAGAHGYNGMVDWLFNEKVIV